MKLRVVVYAQHLTGVGHYVRSYEIARSLAARHEVHFVEGGRTVPRANPAALQTIRLPGIQRGAAGGGLEALGADARPIETVLRERRITLSESVAAIRPEALIVEHFPFSKWELRGEILAAVDATRTSNPSAKVVCSLRDVCRKTLPESSRPSDYTRVVFETLAEHFDALLVHSDPAFTRLEEHVERAAEIPVPVHYTGFVAEQSRELGARPDRPYVVLSAGGGREDLDLVRTCAQAWGELQGDPSVRGRELRVFCGLHWSEEMRTTLERETRDIPARVLPFSEGFVEALLASDLSISRAGYNTCVNILSTGVRALLIPDERKSDQRFRAERMALLGLAEVVRSPALDVATLSTGILRALSRPRTSHEYSLDGAQNTRERIESLVS